MIFIWTQLLADAIFLQLDSFYELLFGDLL